MSTLQDRPIRPAVRTKEFHFPLTVEWRGGRRVAAVVEGKQPVEVVPPPEFKGIDPSTWSPEDMFVAAAASCLAITFTGLAERAGLSFSALEVDGDGVAGMRDDGKFGFTRMQLRLRLETAIADVEAARELAAMAKETCLVTASFALPVETVIEVEGV